MAFGWFFSDFFFFRLTTVVLADDLFAHPYITLTWPQPFRAAVCVQNFVCIICVRRLEFLVVAYNCVVVNCCELHMCTLCHNVTVCRLRFVVRFLAGKWRTGARFVRWLVVMAT